MSVGETIERRHDTQGLDRKLAPQHPLLQFQLCLRVQAVAQRTATPNTSTRWRRRSIRPRARACDLANSTRSSSITSMV
jgi:hypothetical protein